MTVAQSRMNTPDQSRLTDGATTSLLDNGMQIVVIPDHRAPVVTHMVWYRNGSADDPVGKSGIAHFLEHLMFKGTARYPAGEFSKIIAELGGEENAFTSYDYTAYFQRIAREHLATVMDYEADRMANLAFDDDVVGPERDVVLEERRMRVDADPGAQMREEMLSASYLHHPYGLPVIGWEHEIETLNRDDAFAYYRRFYTPENAILVVSGDVEPGHVKALAQDHYGKVARRGDAPVRVRPQEPEPRAARRVTVADARVEQPLIYKSYHAPNYRDGGAAAFALDVAAAILGDGPTSRLYIALVVEQQIATSAHAYYSGSMLDSGRMGFAFAPAPGIANEELETAFETVIATFIKDGPTQGEIDRAKVRLVADTIYARDSQSSMARIYGAALASGETLEDVALWPERIERVTAAEIIEAVAKSVRHNRAVTGLLVKGAA
jgi:zinc protease